MQEAEGLNFKCGVVGEQNKNKKITSGTFGVFNNPNLDDVIFYIKRLGISQEDKDKLIKVATKTPHGSLSNFVKNYMLYLKK